MHDGWDKVEGYLISTKSVQRWRCGATSLIWKFNKPISGPVWLTVMIFGICVPGLKRSTKTEFQNSPLTGGATTSNLKLEASTSHVLFELVSWYFVYTCLEWRWKNNNQIRNHTSWFWLDATINNQGPVSNLPWEIWTQQSMLNTISLFGVWPLGLGRHLSLSLRHWSCMVLKSFSMCLYVGSTQPLGRWSVTACFYAEFSLIRYEFD